MFNNLLSENIVGSECFGDVSLEHLYPQELALISNSVFARQKEFSTARWCARKAMQQLGYPPSPILRGINREPLWPEGLVGSITHCLGYRAAVLARNKYYHSIGIDAEPHLPLPNDVLITITSEEERKHLLDLKKYQGNFKWDRILFSIKESIFKSWYPITHTWLDFNEANIYIDPLNGVFEAKLLLKCHKIWPYSTNIQGKWIVSDRLIRTLSIVPRFK